MKKVSFDLEIEQDKFISERVDDYTAQKYVVVNSVVRDLANPDSYKENVFYTDDAEKAKEFARAIEFADFKGTGKIKFKDQFYVSIMFNPMHTNFKKVDNEFHLIPRLKITKDRSSADFNEPWYTTLAGMIVYFQI